MRHQFFLLILLSLAVILVASEPPRRVPEATVITFASQDDFNQFTGSGGFCDNPAKILQSLEQYVKANAPHNYVRYDEQKIAKQGCTFYFYVFAAKDCRRLSKYVKANLFVMARVHLVHYKLPRPDDEPQDCKYDVEVKAYSLISDSEKVLFKADDVPLNSLPTLLQGQEDQLWQQIVEFSQPK